MKVTGGCFCGHIRYEAEIDEAQVIACHCTRCQNSSGAPYRLAARVVGDSFTLLSGTLKSHESVADSGFLRTRPFCPECGTQIYAATVGEGFQFTGLRVGTIDQRDQLSPTVQMWCRSAQPWAIIDNVPQFEQQPSLDDGSKATEQRKGACDS